MRVCLDPSSTQGAWTAPQSSPAGVGEGGWVGIAAAAADLGDGHVAGGQEMYGALQPTANQTVGEALAVRAEDA